MYSPRDFANPAALDGWNFPMVQIDRFEDTEYSDNLNWLADDMDLQVQEDSLLFTDYNSIPHIRGPTYHSPTWASLPVAAASWVPPANDSLQNTAGDQQAVSSCYAANAWYSSLTTPGATTQATTEHGRFENIITPHQLAYMASFLRVSSPEDVGDYAQPLAPAATFQANPSIVEAISPHQGHMDYARSPPQARELWTRDLNTEHRLYSSKQRRQSSGGWYWATRTYNSQEVGWTRVIKWSGTMG
ncbi:hypothetical protein BC834DRAFT_846337 [Gloeopeniophorella convolvens]|nr:hypothetical protein BC834DRAFT_846337 [Gloeopeniophorella convolvens]